MKLLLLTFVFASCSFAAIPANLVLEVRPTTGSDTNGGGFIAGAAGSDMSQFPSPNSGGCSAGTTCFSSTANLSSVLAQTTNTTTLTCAACVFTTAITGNIVYLSLGGGSCMSGTVSTQWRSVTYASATTITLDVTPAGGGTTCTGLTMDIGGALATLGNACNTVLGFATAPFSIFAKAESGLTQTATTTCPTSGTPLNNSPFGRLQGYTTTRTDGGTLAITESTNTGLTALAMGPGWSVLNISIDCASLGTCTGLTLGNYSQAYNVKVANCTTSGISATGASGDNKITRSEVTGCGSSATPVTMSDVGIELSYSYIHDNAATGVTITAAPAYVHHNIIARNTGSTSIHGLTTNQSATYIDTNIFDSNGGDGARLSGSTSVLGFSAKCNIFYSNGTYGLEQTNSAYAAAWQYDGNAYGANGTAARHNLDDTSVNKLDGVASYVNTLDVTLSADPWVSRAAGNYTLNSTTGGGAAIASSCFPGAFGVGTTSTTGYVGFGPIQPQGGAGQVGYAQ